LWESGGSNPVLTKSADVTSLIGASGITTWRPGEFKKVNLGPGIAEISGDVAMSVTRMDGNYALRMNLEPDASGWGGQLFVVSTPEGSVSGYVRYDQDKGVYQIQTNEFATLQVNRIPLETLICSTNTSTDVQMDGMPTAEQTPEGIAVAAASSSEVPQITYKQTGIIRKPQTSNYQNYNLVFDISPPAKVATQITYALNSRSATSGTDFVAKTGTIQIQQNASAFALPIQILGGNRANYDKTLEVSFSETPDLIQSTPATITLKGYATAVYAPQPAPPMAPDGTQGLIPIWSSKPTATKVIYLEFGGATLTGTAWNTINDPVVSASIRDKYGDLGLQKMWEIVSNAYAAFNVNVTTDKLLYLNTANANKVWVLFTQERDALYGQAAGGVAILGSFGNPAYQPALAFTDWTTFPDFMGLVAAHETGHTFGLHHDGLLSPLTEYYGQSGTGNYTWGPWMGSSYNSKFNQWSAGEYYSASNTENDVAIISAITGYVTDEAGTSPANAVTVIPSTTANTIGTISTAIDKDYYKLTPATGRILKIYVGRACVSDSSIFLGLRLLTSTGVVSIPSTDAGWAPTATGTTWTGIPPAGALVIEVSGIGTGNPLLAPTGNFGVSGFTNYGSIGKYALNVAYAITPPTVTINQAATQADPINISPVNFTVVFSEAVSDFATGDVTITGTATGTKTATVTGSGTTYNVAVSGLSGSGTVIASIASGIAHDADGDPNAASTSTDNSVTYDISPPTVTINQAAAQADPTNGTLINFTVVFSKAVADFEAGDVTITGTAPGIKTATVTGSGTTYNVAVSGATGTGTVIVAIAAGAAHDTIGNPNVASTSTDNTVTYDISPPTVSINQGIAQSDPTSALPINFTAVFSKPVADFATGDVAITGTATGTKTAVVTGGGTTYNVAVSGVTGTGTVVASVAASVAHDAAGNPNAASTSTDNTVNYDITPPAVTINQASAQADPTNISTINFTVQFSKSVNDFATGDAIISGTAPGAKTATVTGSGTTYNLAVTGLTGSGTVIGTVAPGVAHDALGNGNTASTSTDNSVTYDISPPTVTINQATAQADPTNGSLINFTVVFNKPVTDFETGDVTITGTAPGTKTATVTGSGTTYNVAVSGMTDNGTVIASIAPDVAHDAFGYANVTSTSTDNAVNYDITPPTVTINQAAAQADPTGVSPINFTAVFSKPVTDFTSGDVTISGTATGTKTATVTGSGTTYNVSVGGATGNGTVIVDIAAGATHDVSGNANTSSTSTDNTVTRDMAYPRVTITKASTQATPTNSSPINFTVAFTEVVVGFTAAGLTITGTTPGIKTATVTGSGATYNVAVSGMTGSGDVTISIPDFAAHDLAGNPSYASNSLTISYDIIPPTVTINQAPGQTDPTKGLPIAFTAVFSKWMADFDATDVTISGTAPGVKTDILGLND